MVEDIKCTDAQPLMFPDDEDMGIPPHRGPHVSDDTQMPTAASFCSVQTEQEVREEDCVEDDAGDDEVLDPTWNEGCLLYTSPSPRDKRQSRMPSSA